MSDGVIELQKTVEQGNVNITKFRGSDFVGGYHELQLSDLGIVVFPCLVPERVSDFKRTIGEFKIAKYGIKVGKPLTHLRGILRGVPESNNE